MEILIILGVLVLFMSVLFGAGLVTRNNGVADIGYGLAVIVVVLTALSISTPHYYGLFLVALVCLWGVRLALRIYLKNRGKPEDFRYRAWREAWRKAFVWRSFLQIYMLQGAVIFLVALPVTLSVLYPSSAPIASLFYAGVCAWVIGFLFEAISDHQLDSFLRDPENKGRIMTRGLWHYSRHPNYFGESLQWWGIAIAASSVSAVPFLGFVSPALITYLLLRVSGVPMLEEKWKGNSEWETYKKKTSVFIPLPPKHIL